MLKTKIAIAVGLTVFISACGGGGGTSSSGGGITGSSVFPTGLALSSPVGMESGATSLAQASPASLFQDMMLALVNGQYDAAGQFAMQLLPVSEAQAATTKSPRYLKAANAINALLTGSTLPRAGVGFNASEFLKTPVNANCYGPAVSYEGHPDGTPANSTFPTGDLGLWTTTENKPGNTNGWACASAQLDARMDGVSMRVNTGLMTLASLINVANSAGKSAPSVGATLDLKTEMNTAFNPDITFTTANVSQPSSGTYSYKVEFTFKDGSATRNAEMNLTHTPGSSKTVYYGLLTYAVSRGNTDLQNCAGKPNGGSDGTVDVGSLKYTRTSSTAMTLVHREGNHCGAGTATPLTTSYATFGTDGQLDPAGKWSGTKGWANNFNRFGADYNPTTMKGNYAFGWQAGMGDNNTRIFNIGLNYDSATERRDGEAFFGFGDDISTSNGAIKGFICNWAGPGNTKSLVDYAQRQNIAFDDATGKWLPTNNASSDITYAPTNNCISAGGAFYYDKNADGFLTDEKTVSPNPAVNNGLFSKGTSANITAAITGRGITIPSY